LASTFDTTYVRGETMGTGARPRDDVALLASNPVVPTTAATRWRTQARRCASVPLGRVKIDQHVARLERGLHVGVMRTPVAWPMRAPASWPITGLASDRAPPRSEARRRRVCLDERLAHPSARSGDGIATGITAGCRAAPVRRTVVIGL
jgi:hypothetical protein